MRWLERSLLVLAIALVGGAAAAADAPETGATAPETDETAPPPVAGAPSADVRPVGSPPPLARRIVLRGIKFGSDTAYIEPASAGVLELVAEQLREQPDVRVRIEGYTDERASDAYNLELSHERAESVKRILVGFGIPATRLDVVGRGEAQPIAPNDSPEGRALNRRVELEVIE